MIAEMRTGSKEWNEYPADAPMNMCNGDSNLDGTLFTTEERGEFTKEYLANPLREGWANFVSAVTWNDRTQTDCEFQVVYKRHDYDLDGIVDDDRTGGDLDGAYDCEGIPTISGDPAIEAYVTSENWLGNVVLADDDDVDGRQCVATADADAEAFNRATVMDVTRMHWDLTTDQNLQPGKLSNLYVDMCPRGWDSSDTSLGTDASPYERLLLSADGQAITTEVGYELSHIYD